MQKPRPSTHTREQAGHITSRVARRARVCLFTPARHHVDGCVCVCECTQTNSAGNERMNNGLRYGTG